MIKVMCPYCETDITENKSEDNIKHIAGTCDGPLQFGFSMAPFGYTITMERRPDGSYGCGGRDGCNAKYWMAVGETAAHFRRMLRGHVDAAH